MIFDQLFYIYILYKIVAKWPKSILPFILSPWSAFVANRVIARNVIVAFESFHVMKQPKG